MRLGSCCPRVNCPNLFTVLRNAFERFFTNFRSTPARTAGAGGEDGPPSGTGSVNLGGASSSPALSTGSRGSASGEAAAGPSGGLDQPGSSATSLENLDGDGQVNVGYESDADSPPSTPPIPRSRRSSSSGSGDNDRSPSPPPSQRHIFLSSGDGNDAMGGETSTDTPPQTPPQTPPPPYTPPQGAPPPYTLTPPQGAPPPYTSHTPPLGRRPNMLRDGGASGGNNTDRSPSPTSSEGSGSDDLNVFGYRNSFRW